MTNKTLELTVDIRKLQNTLLNRPELFNVYDNRLSDKGPHRESNDIWARYGDIVTNGTSVFTNEHDSVWYPIIKEIPEVLNISMDIMSYVKGERLGGVLITKLDPGKTVYMHTDTEGWHPNYYDKFYIPINSKAGASFNFEDTTLEVPEGSVTWFRNDVPHGVINNSCEPRIAMVVCIKPLHRGFLNV